MSGNRKMTLPKFLEGEKLPSGYYDDPNPYKSAPSCHLDLPALSRYAKSVGKQIAELSREELEQFKV